MYQISKNKCVGCGTCVDECPVDAVYLKSGVATIEQEECVSCGDCLDLCPQNSIRDIQRVLLFAIGTDDNNEMTDDHVGMSRYFQVWKYLDGEMTFEERRENPKYTGDETRAHGDPNKAQAISSVLGGIDVLVGRMFGPNIVRLKKKYVCAVVREPDVKRSTDIIKDNINEIIEEKEKSGEKRIGLILR